MEAQNEESGATVRHWLEQMGLVRLGLLEIALGVVGSVLGVVMHVRHHEWAAAFLSHVGVGFMAAGLLTATVEYLSHRRHQRQIDEAESRTRDFLVRLQNATAGTILRQFIPETVLEEVQQQIVRKPFIRFDFRLVLQFAWEDAAHTRLLRRARVSYRVKNASQSPQVFELRAAEDWPSDEQPALVDITHLYVRREPDGKGRLQNLAVERKKELTDSCLMVEEKIPLNPDESVSVVWKSVRECPVRDKSAILFNHAMRGLALDVHHPVDLAVTLQIHHPDDGAFIVDESDPDHHAWHFDGGFLPFQGVALSWKKVVPPTDRVPVLALAGETPLQDGGHDTVANV
jgi:hypothetical protein